MGGFRWEGIRTAAEKSYPSNPFQHRTVIASLGILEETSGKRGGKDTNMRFLRVGLAYVCVDVRTLTLEPCELELFVSSFNRYLRFVY
jgi:hypothetical protein